MHWARLKAQLASAWGDEAAQIVDPATVGRPVEDGWADGGQRICIPEIAREMTSRWISEVPSKMV